MKIIKSHSELNVYQAAFSGAMEIFNATKAFPKEEKFSLTDQIRRSSRSICANISEAFRKRRYPRSFILKLNDAEAEAVETQCWLEFAFKCNYINKDKFRYVYDLYDNILGKLVRMMNQPEKWSI